jgi:hypothetical protein
VTSAPTPVDAIAAVTQAGGGSPTRRAIEAALAGLALDNAAQQAASPSVAAHQSALRTAQEALHDSLGAAALSPAAQSQKLDAQATLPVTAPAAAADAAALMHNVAAPHAVPLQGMLAVPVALSTLQTASAAGSARAQGAVQHDRLARVQRHDGQRHGADAFDERDDSGDAPSSPDDATPGEEEITDERIARWLDVLTAAGQDEALRDVRLSRQVLLVLPQRPASAAATVPARAVLLGTRGVTLLDAQWWPGAAVAASDAAAWQRFRLFRDGDLLLRGGLRTRAGNRACRLLLGASSAAAANAAGALIDTQAARLLLTERARVAQALLAQWTLLMLVVAQGAAHA